MRRQAEPQSGVLVDLQQPEDVRAYLMSPEKHWKDGRSAAELTYAWWDGVPPAVSATLATDPDLRGATCDQIVFEKRSKIPAAGGATRSDLMAYFRAGEVAFIAAVEGKAGESFDLLCCDWLDAGSSSRSPDNRRRRLAELCRIVGCDAAAALTLRYQLFVRAAAALGEASSTTQKRALVLVHSFDAATVGADDFFRFASTLGADIDGFNRLSRPVARGSVSLQLGWASDRARA